MRTYTYAPTSGPGFRPEYVGTWPVLDLLGDDADMDTGRCPACGDPIDFCTGHGPIGDPVGARILDQHDDGDHGDCDPRGCDDAAGAQ